MSRPRALALVLALALSLAAAAAAQALDRSLARVRARGWAPWVKLALGREAAPERVAVERLENGISTIGTVLNGLTADEATRAFFSRVLEQLESFDLEALYDTLPEPCPEQTARGVFPWRQVRFTGRREDVLYRVETVAKDAPCACDPDGRHGGRFGDLAVAFRSRPAAANEGEDNKNFVGSARMGMGLGAGSWDGILAALVESLKLAETGAPEIARGLDPRSRPAAETRVAVMTDNPKLGPEDVEVLAVFRESFPSLYAELRRLYRVDDVLIWDPLGNAPYRQIRLVLAVREEAAKESYPELWSFLEGLGPLARGRVDVEDARGRRLSTFRFSTKDLAIELDAFTRDGRVLPVDGGNVLEDEGIDLRAVRASQHRMRCGFSFEVNGITTELRDLIVKVDYARPRDDGEVQQAARRAAGDETMAMRFVLDEEPRVAVTGAAFGIVPTWAIDVLIPGDLEGLTKDFFRVLAKGNDGQGLRASARVRRGAHASVAELDGTAEGLNNTVVRLGFKIARRKLIPSDAAVADIARALRATHEAFGRDLAGFAGDVR